jgi:5-oxoprolinase (ATP-hydrolysing) subunit A
MSQVADSIMSHKIDLNCDLGESFGHWQMGHDAGVIPFVSSINIACGFHGGDARTMLRTLQLARLHDVAVGAHTGLPDLRGFGRREMQLDPDDLYCDTLYQLGALAALTRSLGLALKHIKPHGALYHMLERQPLLAASFVRAAQDFSTTLAIMGLAQGNLLRCAITAGMPVKHEMFADRTYQANGQLQARGQPGAVIDDAELAAAQILRVLRTGKLIAIDGAQVSVHADTVCIHGDRTDAALFAAALHAHLRTAGVVIGVNT